MEKAIIDLAALTLIISAFMGLRQVILDQVKTLLCPSKPLKQRISK